MVGYVDVSEAAARSLLAAEEAELLRLARDLRVRLTIVSDRRGGFTALATGQRAIANAADPYHAGMRALELAARELAA